MKKLMKLLATVLSFLMCLTLFGVVAHAEKNQTSGISDYSSLVSALNNASMDENSPTVIQLAADIDTTGELIVPSGAYVVLDLNGHVINRGGKDSRVMTNNGILTIIDSNPDATHNPEITYTDPIDDTTEVSISGGIIKGGTASYGAGIYVKSTGKLILKGGTIALNVCSYQGGGIYVDGGTFTMDGGYICGNECYHNGAGAYIINNATATINGGEICGNYLTYGEGDGAGLYGCTGSEIIINDGLISRNKAAQGGGMALYDNAKATMNGGKICNNISTWNRSGGGGVNIYACQYFNMTGGEINDNEALSGNGGGVRLRDVTFNMSGDAVIKDNKAATEGGAIYVYYNTATINMSGNALIKDNEADSNGGGIKNGTVIMKDNAGIDGNISNGGGGGINGYSVSMSDNAFVDNNISHDGRGGAGIVSDDVNISDEASVSGNRFEVENYNGWGGAGGIYSEGTITMTGGHIDNNYSSADGGGIGIYYYAKLVISGGTITGNKAKRNSGAIQDDGDYTAHVDISGNPVIMNNTAGDDDKVSNVRYGRDYFIHVVGPLTEGAQIGVTAKAFPTQTDPAKIADGYSEYNTEDPSNFFVSDEGFLIFKDTDGNVKAVSSWQQLGKLLNMGGTVKLTQDIKALPGDGPILIEDNTTVTLDLNGHILDGGGYPQYILKFYRKENVDFTIIDSNPNAEHTPAVTYTDPVTNETVTLKGGIMTGASSRGIFIDGMSTKVTMKGGSLTGSNGGVFLVNSTFYMEGGSICGNNCTVDGGGVWPYYGGTFNMSGGSICGNTAAGSGGGVFLWENQSSHSSMYLSGGTIKNNVSVGYGGGIRVDNRGHLYVSGNPEVYNNKKDDILNNISSVNYGVFVINGEITSGAKFEATGVPSLGSWNKLTDGFSKYNPDSNPADYFFPAEEGAFISLYDGEATLYANNVITFDANGGTGEMPSLKNIGGWYTLPENSFTAPEHKKFRKWKIGNREYAPGTDYNFNDNVDVIAMWDDIPQYTITYDVKGGNELEQNSYTLYEGEEYGEMPVPTREGYVFDGWFTDANEGDKVASTDICQGSITFYAHWSIIIHKFDQKNTDDKYMKSAATCNEKAVYYYSCSDCGEIDYDNTFTSGDALGHDWNEGVVTKEATETAEGLMTYTCNRCEETKTETIPKKEHVHNLKHVDAKAATCTEAGNSEYWYCDKCDKYYSSQNASNEIQKDGYVIAATGHKWDSGVVTKEATEDAEGVKTFTCSKCGEAYTESIPKLEPANPVKAFVTRFYTIILQRDTINDEEIEYYTSRLLSHELDGCSVAKGFVMSPEYTDKGEDNLTFVNKMYAAFFNREADDAQFYINLLESGQTREVVLAGFVNSPEFKNLCADYGIDPGELVVEPENNNPENNNPENNQGNGENNQGNNPTDEVTKLNLDTTNVDPDKLDAYVKNLYLKILGRQYDEGGLEYWKEQIMAGTTYDASTAARVGFFESPEYQGMNKTSEQFVTDCYHAFLDREPEPDGLSYWMDKLDSGEYSKQKVIDLGFGHSEEFKGILRDCGFEIIE